MVRSISDVFYADLEFGVPRKVWSIYSVRHCVDGGIVWRQLVAGKRVSPDAENGKCGAYGDNSPRTRQKNPPGKGREESQGIIGNG
jgi:hypothetical protein